MKGQKNWTQGDISPVTQEGYGRERELINEQEK